MRKVKSFMFGVGLLACPLLSFAHHSFAMFDMAHRQSVSGTVRSLEWVSPHVWLWVLVPNAANPNDVPVTYGFETVSPGQLLRDFGWDRHALNAGDKIKVDYAPLKNGQPGGSLVRVTLANGTVLKTRLSDVPVDGERGAGSPQN